MLLGFKQRFAPMVEDGSKTHTIRGKRKRPPKVGETCHCYVDPRQKSMRLLGRWVCVKVEEIVITKPRASAYVWIDGAALQRDELNALAWRDGFRSRGRAEAFLEMMEFWKGRLPFEGCRSKATSSTGNGRRALPSNLRAGGICHNCGCWNPPHPICGICGLAESNRAEALLLARELKFEGGPFCRFCESEEATAVCSWPKWQATPKRIELAEVGDVWITEKKKHRARIQEVENLDGRGKVATPLEPWYRRRIWVRIPGHPNPYPYERTNGMTFTTEELRACDQTVCWRHQREVAEDVVYCVDHWRAWEEVAAT